jgi:hypothetical protein
MPRIRQIDIGLLDKIFDMEGGYVLRFTDRTMREFFANDLNIDINDPRYAVDGPSKARRVRCFLRVVDTPTAVRVLYALWEQREGFRQLHDEPETMPNAHGELLGIIDRLQGGGTASQNVPMGQPIPAFDKAIYPTLLTELMGLHAIDPHPRGYAFEAFLRKAFTLHGLLARGGFRITGEQIDGSFYMEGETYLFEAKWQNAQTAAQDLHAFQGKLNERPTWARGLFVSYNGFTDEGLIAFGKGKSVVCMDGFDLSECLRRQIPLNHALVQKVRRSVETGEVLARVRDLFPER